MLSFQKYVFQQSQHNEHSLLPQCYSEILPALKFSRQFPCTVEALTSNDGGSLTGKPLSQTKQCSLPRHAPALAL